MINVNEAIELTNEAVIPFPTNWREQMVNNCESSIKSQAKRGKRLATIQGKVQDQGNWQNFFLTPEQFSEISAILKANGFRVDEDFRVRYDGQPLTIDIFW